MDKKIVFTFFLIISTALFSCSEWTEMESIDIKEPDITAQNPELYAKYLENLCAYKKSEHKQVYVWFDNSEKTPRTRAHHLTTLPDSIDVVSLIHPDQLADWELQEMNEVRSQKGMEVIYTISFDAIKAFYNAKLEKATDEEPVASLFEDFLVDSLQHALSLAKKYEYDGICIEYSGKSMLHMREPERTEYTKNERIFMGIAADWQKRNPEKSVVFEGKPQNLIDKTFLEKCKMVMVSGKNATNENMLTYHLSLAAVEGVPQSRLGMVVSATSLNDPNKLYGYFANGELAMQGLANWAPMAHNGIEVAGVGVYNVSTDYYEPTRTYHYTRSIISSINPPVK
ncbi:MAG: glycoside hydrolase family 18 [Bacteroides pyogenes]|uniref:glycoside hydrolase family 18 n=1 Tax=Bacteroides pyogenes TaxID=310300 RepID=UPI002A918BAE|nr:glycoside hydrolase family 18 [Bacteroides pyogenes]MDY5354590.1 glycoside hydrolase family 18 [Bacteroides pyogenes]